MLKNIVREIYHLWKFLYSFLKFNTSLDNFLKNCTADTMIVTHNIGGGTEQYVKNNFYNGNCLIVRNIAPYRRFSFSIIEDTNQAKKVFIKNRNISRVFSKKYKNVIINSVAQFYNAFDFLKLCVDLKTKFSNTNILYLVHDFNCICPTNNLVANGFYCGLKCDLHKCKISPAISEWRKNWSIFLQNCDEVRCFSTSSKQIVQTVYSELDKNKITVIPHDMSYSKFTPVTIKKNSEPIVAIIGRCSTEPKGANVLPCIVNRISENVKIVFIGTKYEELKIKHKNVRFLGKYNHDELQQIIEREKVTHTIFPSVCPETFSYLVSEIIQMQLPIFCFNLGAQAEKVSEYEKGFVLENEKEMIEKINEILNK